MKFDRISSSYPQIVYMQYFFMDSNLIVTSDRTILYAKKIDRDYREAFMLSRLLHPNIPQIHGIIKWKNTYLLEQFCIGCSLAQWIRRTNEGSKEWILKELERTVQYLHSRKVIHADIKPENIIINEKERHLWLIDYGESGFLNLRCTNRGTPGFRLPDCNVYSYQMDWYSFQKIQKLLNK